MTRQPRTPAEQSDVTVSSRVVLELARGVERCGVPRDEFLRAAKIQPAWLDSEEVRWRRADVFGFCQVALDVTRDPAFGLHWGEWITGNSFNLMSHLLVHSSDLRQVFATLRRFGQLVTDEVSVEFVETDDMAEVRSIGFADQPLPVQRLTAEVLMLGLISMIRQVVGQHVKFSRVSFQYPAPDYRDEYARLFEGAERFDQPFTGLTFERALLQAHSQQKDEGLYSTLSDLAERRLLRLQKRAPYAVRVRQHLMEQPSPHRVPMPEVARSLGVSVRSLNRRLSEEGHSYISLANEASAQLAKRLLLDDGLTIQETAHRMGFANVSSFHRAFRRWTGTTPGTFLGQGPRSDGDR